MLPAAAIYLGGLILAIFARGLLPVILAGLVTMSGMMLTTAAGVPRSATTPHQIGSGWCRDCGMIGYVLIPMVIGPFIGAAMIRAPTSTTRSSGCSSRFPPRHFRRSGGGQSADRHSGPGSAQDPRVKPAHHRLLTPGASPWMWRIRCPSTRVPIAPRLLREPQRRVGLRLPDRRYRAEGLGRSHRGAFSPSRCCPG